MTDQQHPITPPPELVQQWVAETWHEGTPVRVAASDLHIATEAARWGSDQELEACITWVAIESLEAAKELRTARRPKLPSLKEQALALVEQHEDGWRPSPKDWDTIRCALEQLDG